MHSSWPVPRALAGKGEAFRSKVLISSTTLYSHAPFVGQYKVAGGRAEVKRQSKNLRVRRLMLMVLQEILESAQESCNTKAWSQLSFLVPVTCHTVHEGRHRPSAMDHPYKLSHPWPLSRLTSMQYTQRGMRVVGRRQTGLFLLESSLIPLSWFGSGTLMGPAGPFGM